MMLGSSSDSSLLAMARVAQGEFAPIEERPAKRPRPRSQEGGALEKDWKAPLHQKFLAAAEHGNAASMATLLANPLMRDVNMRSARGLTWSRPVQKSDGISRLLGLWRRIVSPSRQPFRKTARGFLRPIKWPASFGKPRLRKK